MKKINSHTKMHNFMLCILALLISTTGYAQPATINIPVGIGSAGCGYTGVDSIKYYDYNANLDVLTHRWNCRPDLVAPGFSDNLATIQFNPYDGNLYFGQITSSSGIYTTHMYRWLPTVCPGPALPKYQVFNNQLVAGMEFDPATGLGYQINFVDITGDAPVQVDNAATVGTYTSAEIVSGNPAIAYYDLTNTSLKYVRAIDPQARNWNTPITVSNTANIGQYTSMVIVNGNPAIVYYDVTNMDLRYVRANDAFGTTWGTPVAVVTTDNVGEFASMAIVNGNPAITYYNNTNDDLVYVRATNANGTAWGTPVILDAGGNVGQHTSLKVVNGNPAVSYLDVTNTSLKYIRASDASGTTWGTGITVSNVANDGYYSSLEIVNGNPAIAHYENGAGDLKYVRASDATGASWPASTTLVTADNAGQYASLKIINGNPAVAYYDGGDLEYIRAADVNGAGWGSVVAAESAGNVGGYASLIVAHGHPAIAYYGSTNTDLRFVRAGDANGDKWFTNSGAYDMELQQVDFSTNTLGISRRVDFGSHYIYRQSGDVVMTPSGQMLGIFDNKYFNLNWKDYSTALPLVATFIDSINLGTAGHNLIGLSYSDGKLIGSIRRNSSTCYYREIDILTGGLTNITNVANNFSSADMTTISTGVGAAKSLVSAVENPVGSGIYDIVYNVRVQNFGGTPISNLQVYDTLNMINGFANLISGSVTSIISPTGIIANAAYNGKTVFSLLTPGATLSNIPGQNVIDIQITCRVANILPGIVYYNQAVVNATNIFGDPLRDLSTNGNNPDLNLNDKPDDVGESQPTPLLISVAAVTPPCATLTRVLYTQTFGAGTGLTTTIAAPVAGSGVASVTGTTDYLGSVTAPIPIETYTITNNANNAHLAHFINLTDHTGNTNGRMLLVNADADNAVFYRGRINMSGSLCANQQYSLSFYAAFIGNSNYQIVCNAFGGFTYPKIKMRIRDAVAAGYPIITEVSTGNITNTAWQQYGLKFVSPGSYTAIIIELVNDAPGGCGNDFVIDDIQFGSCDPAPNVTVNGTTSGCIGYTTVFSANLSDPATIPGVKAYQWQVANAAAGPWADIPGETNATYTILSVNATHAGKYYRVRVAAAGNLGNPSCEYISPGILLTARTPSVAPTAATANKNYICPGIVVSLGITGGTLGTNATWRWYSGTCGGTFVGTGASINVTPTVTTTYFVRAEGDCNITNCQQITVFISCDLDKDKDGIPDWVESYTLPAALTNTFNTGYAGYVDNNFDFVNDNFQADGDSDNDGILNYLDTNFPGRIDTNSDGVDDRFDFDLDGIINMLDLDSDNDGIPDVVEAGGVDANGDGRLDNYSDTDNDGISQNVDLNNTGVRNSGNGLGAINLDNDTNPNAIDLDSDNDGIPDVVEAEGPDTNNDGKIDGFVDANTDGLHDNYINATGLLRTGADVNADGRADSYPYKNFDNDRRPNCYDLDSDADGITDVREAGFTDGVGGVGSDGFIDGTIGANGWSTTISALPTLSLINTDGRGRPNFMDIDSDDDGIPDNVEGMSTATYRLPTGVDTDNDGLDNAYEPFGPYTATFGGPGNYPYDHDFDGIPDYMDLDTDSDGSPDIAEGHDYNGNGIADDGAFLSYNDADGDGLDDTFDAINSTTDIYGTSAFMGNSGSFSGDATPGSLCSVQKFIPSQIDRDWRYTFYVLDVQLLSFKASLQNHTSLLNWSLITSDEIRHFEIEKSLNGQTFVSIQQLQKNVPLHSVANYFTTDDLQFETATEVYYRLKIVAANGQIKYSSVVVVKLNKKQSFQFSVHPNPAKDLVNASFTASVEGEAIIRIIDNLGKIILMQKQFINKGNNKITLQGLSKFANAVYSLQVVLPNEVLTQKLIIHNR